MNIVTRDAIFLCISSCYITKQKIFHTISDEIKSSSTAVNVIIERFSVWANLLPSSAFHHLGSSIASWLSPPSPPAARGMENPSNLIDELVSVPIRP